MNLAELAKKAVELYIAERKVISSDQDLPKEFFEKKSGVFVSIFRSPRRTDAEFTPHQILVGGKRGTDAEKQLRGCIGTYLSTKENIVKEIIDNAIAAATEDYRFGPIQKEELPYFSYTVYILSTPELVKDIKELDPKKYGIIVKTLPISYPGTDVMFDGHTPPKSGLLLPDLEGVDTVEQQISIACQKGGINPEVENFFIYKFTVKKHNEK